MLRRTIAVLALALYYATIAPVVELHRLFWGQCIRDARKAIRDRQTR